MAGNRPYPTFAPLEDDPGTALANHVIATCHQAWKCTYQAQIDRGECEYTANQIAGQAYRSAMPPLSGYESTCDFIACVAYGVMIGAVSSDMSGKLLYAAQVALGSISKQSQPPQAV